MRSLQTTLAVCLIVLPAATVSQGQGGSMSDDHTLIIAPERNDTATVRLLLKAGANLHTRDAQGRTALLAATAHNHVESGTVLIEAGADVNAQDNQLDSPLLLAGAAGHLEILKLALKAGPNFKV